MDYNIITGELTESYREVLPENTADENSILAVATDEKALSGSLRSNPLRRSSGSLPLPG